MPTAHRMHRLLAGGMLAAACIALFTTGAAHRQIPRVWDEAALKEFELPPPDPAMNIEHISPEYYDALPTRVMYRTYPVYHPDAEPPGYRDSLRALPAGLALDMDTIDTDEEWVRAGEIVFDSPLTLLPLAGPFSAEALARAGVPKVADGTFPFQSYVVGDDGELYMGVAACSNCHLRVMPDGSVLKAVQGNYAFDRLVGATARLIREQGSIRRPGTGATTTVEQYLSARSREQFGAPWIRHTSQSMLDTVSVDRTIALYEAIPPGVLLRAGTSLLYPTKVPDLRGVRDKRFLDATGLVQQRSMGDLMRYAALAEGIQLLERFGDFVPALGSHTGPLPPPQEVRSGASGGFKRFSDAQSYALARYLYSLDPVPSPYTFDAETLALGERVFIEEGCVTCHTPPLYTNNELTPATGFEPPESHYDRFPIFNVSVETDPGLTLYTRRGTGYYKIPSLRGLWYRERLFHDGSLSLEQVLDPARFRDDFVPDGYHGIDSTRAVPGHPFGLELSTREREALLAYLRTL